jgi:leucyl-tRNA synthetase
VTLVVQVNGKLRGRVDVPAGTDRDEAEAAARDNPNVARHLEGKTTRKVILVPDRLLNIVV